MNNNLTRYLIILEFVLLPLFAASLFPLDPNKEITQYILDNWEIQQGLPQNSVSCITQTADGYLWLGTEEGLVSYDGNQFRVFGRANVEQLADNMITALHADRAGNLWIGTYGSGIVCLKEGKFTRYTNMDDKGLSQSRIWCIHEDRDGNLWIGTDTRGVYCLKDGKVTSITVKDGLSDNKIWDIYEDRQGDLWIGTDSGGVNRLKNGRLTAYTVREGLSNNCVWCVCEDRSGNLWIGTNGGGLNRLKDGKFTGFSTKDGLTSNRIKALYEDREGNLWIGTYQGLNRLKNGKFTAYASDREEAHRLIRAIYEDREGSLWWGTEARGLYRLRDGKFTPVTTREGLVDNRVRAVYEDREGNLWVGTYKGLNCLKNGKITVFTGKDGLSDDMVQAICQDREGNLWLGTFQGLNRLDPKTGKITVYTAKEGLSDNNIYVICEDREGSLWIGAQKGGLTRIKDGEFTRFTKKHGLGSEEIRCIYEDSAGNLWIGTDGGGLNHRNPRNGKFTLYTTDDGLSSNVMAAFYEDSRGTLWIGTYGGGLNRLKDGKFSSITSKDGLFDDVVYSILEDESWNLWMSCNKGIFRVNKKELNDFIDEKNKNSSPIHCVSYDEKDGMKSRECIGGTSPSGWKTRDNKFWFSTIAGAVMIDPGNVKINRQEPPVVIEEIITDNRNIQPPFSRFYSKQEGLHLSTGSEQVEIHYTALSFLVPDKVRFKYKLEGYDNEWRDVGIRRVAYYTKIPPGNYRFRVIACNDDDVWNETGASVSFYLDPFFFQTWWFYLLCALGVSFTAVGTFRFRVRQLTRHKVELEQLVAQRTHQLTEANKKLQELDQMKTDFLSFASHELRTPLTSVLGFARIIKKRLDQRVFPMVRMEDKKTSKAVEQVSSNIDIILSEGLRLTALINNVLDITKMEAGKIEWKKETVSIASILESAREATAGLFENKPLKMIVEVRDTLPDIEGDKDRLVQVFINLISNAVKFTEKGTVTCRARCIGKDICISVTDTGIGIAQEDLPKLFEKFKQVSDTLKTNQKGTGLGLPICKQIVEYHGGEITVESELGKGTTFTVKLPLNQ